MVNAIGAIDAEVKLAQLLGDDFVAQQTAAASPIAPTSASEVQSGNMFDTMLSKAIDSLNGVSRTEFYANQVTDRYLRGEAELQDVMVAQAKMSVMVQLAVTTVNSAVTSFKEITQMQV